MGSGVRPAERGDPHAPVARRQSQVPGTPGSSTQSATSGELWDLPPTGNRVEFEFVDIFRVADNKLIEHWTSMDLAALRRQMTSSS